MRGLKMLGNLSGNLWKSAGAPQMVSRCIHNMYIYIYIYGTIFFLAAEASGETTDHDRPQTTDHRRQTTHHRPKISILATSQPPNPNLSSNSAPTTLQNESTLHQTLRSPFKADGLGIISFIFVRSASRLFLWCNSNLLMLKLRHAHDRFAFLLLFMFSISVTVEAISIYQSIGNDSDL